MVDFGILCSLWNHPVDFSFGQRQATVCLWEEYLQQNRGEESHSAIIEVLLGSQVNTNISLGNCSKTYFAVWSFCQKRHLLEDYFFHFKKIAYHGGTLTNLKDV